MNRVIAGLSAGLFEITLALESSGCIKINRLIILFLIIAFPLLDLYSQGVMKITTDKPVYSYGEPIRVNMKVTNNTDSAFSVRGSSSCISGLTFNERLFSRDCTMDDVEYKFPPGASWVWIWDIIPEESALPDNDSIQVIYGSVSRWHDSVVVRAPKFYGGLLSVSLYGKYSLKELQSIRDSFHASVLHSDKYPGPDSLILETWMIKGYSVDSTVSVLKNDYRIKSVSRAWKMPFFAAYLGISPVSSGSYSEVNFKLSQNYPNPFNPSTTISYSIPQNTYIILKIFDMLGREVSTLVSKVQSAGEYKVQFDGSFLPSGVYIYTLQADGFRDSKKLMLLK